MFRTTSLAVLAMLIPTACVQAQDGPGAKLGDRVIIRAKLDGQIALKDLLSQLEHDHRGLIFVLRDDAEHLLDRTFSLDRTVEGMTVREALVLSLGSMGLTFTDRGRYFEISPAPLPVISSTVSKPCPDEGREAAPTSTVRRVHLLRRCSRR